MSKRAENTIIVVASPDYDAGNDPDVLGLALHHQGPAFINAYCQAAKQLVDQD